MPHSDIVSGGDGAVGTPDQSRQAQERLDRFALEWLVDQFPDHPFPGVGPLDRNGLQEAAELVLADVQTALVSLAADLDEVPLEPRLASSLSRSRYWALLALLEVLPSQKHAKQEQLRITGGAPLAVCTGDACRIGPRRKRMLQTPYVAGGLRFSVYGCNRIFPDATTMVGGMWPSFCPDCNNARRKPARDQERAVKRKIHTMVRRPTIYVTTGTAPEVTRLEGPSRRAFI